METKTIIQSPRLYVRTWADADVQDLYAVMSDPRVHTHTAEDPWSVDGTREMVHRCIAHKLGHEPGYFNCPLILRAGDQLIGRVGLNPFREGERIPEIEWTLGPTHWGQGYATEIGREILRYGFEEAGFPEIVGFARPEHLASRRVMRKIGMRYTGDEEHRGITWSFYGITRAEYDRRRRPCTRSA
jgi:RimJ/RimL family protein N-acetyltransferase